MAKASGLAMIAVVVFAFGFVGTMPIGIHAECTDGIDNDGDGVGQPFDPAFYVDAYDLDCYEFPFADGSGEDPTPTADRFNSLGAAYEVPGYATAFDWVKTQYELNPHPLNLAMGTLPLCHVPGSQAGLMLTWASYPAIEGSQSAYTQHSNQCPP